MSDGVVVILLVWRFKVEELGFFIFGVLRFYVVVGVLFDIMGIGFVYVIFIVL